MRDCSRVPELCNHAAARCMDGISDASPSTNLLRRPQAWRIGPSKSFWANRGGLADDQSGRSALCVVLRLQGSGHMIMRLRAHPGERGHDDAVRKIEVSNSIWCEKWLIRNFTKSFFFLGRKMKKRSSKKYLTLLDPRGIKRQVLFNAGARFIRLFVCPNGIFRSPFRRWECCST